MTQDWKSISSQKQAERASRIPSKWQAPNLHAIDEIETYLTPEEINITRQAAVDLLPQLQNGTLKVRTVVEAFCHRAALAHQLTNCLTEVLFEEALARADELDASESKTGLLFGLPISVKDTVDIGGYDSTVGYIVLANKPKDQNGVFYDLLLRSNPVVIAKTNVPQSMMTADSVNNVWGRTENPHKAGFTAGGSSGGEGALVACRGSVLGIGTDVGGSVRIPALCCGTFGLRPTSSRLPLTGNSKAARLGVGLVKSVIGPLANDPRDLQLLFKALMLEEPWSTDYTVLPIPLRPVAAAPSKFKVGYVTEYGEIFPHPPVLRAIHEAVSALKVAGHEVMDLTPQFTHPSHDMSPNSSTLFSMDLFKSVFDYISAGEEPLTPVLKDLKTMLKGKTITPDNIMEAQESLQSMLSAVHETIYSNLPGNYDVLLMPGAGFSAVPHDSYLSFNYTMLWNLADYPAAAIPVTTVDPKVDQPRSLDLTGKSELAKFTESLWNPDQMKGLPVGIQVIGHKYHEEELLESVAAIAAVLKK